MTEGLDLKLLPRGGLVLCAVSGGADSVCLLHGCCWRLRRGSICASSARTSTTACEGRSPTGTRRFVALSVRAPGRRLRTSGRGDVAAFARENGLGTEEAARRAAL